MSFDRIHGDFTLNVRGHLITCELIGPFNEEGILAWIDEIKSVVNGLNGQSFCALVDHRQHQGVIHSALHHLQDAYAWLSQKNLIAIASLYSTHVLHQVAISRMSPVDPDHIRAFNDHQDALSWLEAVYARQELQG
ncbi:hypothetical protein [Aeromonas salmonicida]|uniref:hypothetical protein n=1 Tax=Aeromonas salmonicida TaxID=645 RepID=UPI003D22A7AC